MRVTIAVISISLWTWYVLFPGSASAQFTIKGTVQSQTSEPLPFANALLLDISDSTLIKGYVADLEGRFTMPDLVAGRYLVKTMMVGFEPGYHPVKLDDKAVANIHIEMGEMVAQLEGIIISDQKPLYEKKHDRMVVNVQSQVTSSGRSVLEVLERSPGVMVNRQSNTIAMYGKSGVRVMINGKMSQMPIDAIVQMLNGMNAANIEKIELITSPPSRYDAEGNAGIINIVMVEKTELGTNGGFGLTAGYNQAETLGGNFNLNHRGNRFNYFVDYSIMSDNNKQPWINEWVFNDGGGTVTDLSDQQRSYRLTVQNLRIGSSYELNSKTTISVLLTGYQRLWDMYDAFTDNFRIFPDSLVHTEMDILEKNQWSSLAGNLGIDHRFNDRQSLSVNYDYLYYIHDNPSSYGFATSVNGTAGENYLIDVNKDTPVNFHVFNLDYHDRLSKDFSISTGIKSIYSTFENDVITSTTINNQAENSQELTDFSSLNEKIMAGYVSWNWHVNDKMKLDGGLRYEYTDTYLSTPDQNGLVDREFGKFFPSLNFAYQPVENSSFQLSYSRRITRPTYNDMAPFVFFIGPTNSVGGNPGLRPSIADNYDVTYNHKFWWISFKYSHIDRPTGWFQPEIYPNYEVALRSHNGEYERIWSSSSGLPFEITSWWETRLDVNLFLRQFRTLHYEQNYSNQNIYFTTNVTSTFKLPKSFTIELSGNYQSASYWGVWEFGPQSQVNLGIKKQFKNHSSLTLSFNDIFDDYILNGSVNLPQHEASNSFTYVQNLRSVNLTLTKRFGDSKLKNINIKSGSEEERKRVN